MTEEKEHRSGFINIIGQPNVGKSTLMNALVGERMSIITSKPQTTRHRIIGIVSGADYQLVFSDTPGIIDEPAYKMQEAMNRFVKGTFEDADLMILVTEVGEKYPEDHPLLQRLQNIQPPLFLVINKIDLGEEQALLDLIAWWQERLNFTAVIPISALHRKGTQSLLDLVLQHCPSGPAYYPKDQLTDKPERFFISEIIREKILLRYQQEIPYSCEVAIESFKESQTKAGQPLIRISALIFVARKSQKAIIIGRQGAAIKKLGTDARKSIETFLESKVFLELHVKIRENWRDDERSLRRFGYEG